MKLRYRFLVFSFVAGAVFMFSPSISRFAFACEYPNWFGCYGEGDAGPGCWACCPCCGGTTCVDDPPPGDGGDPPGG